MKTILFSGFVIFSPFYLVSLKLFHLNNININASPIYYWTLIGVFLYLLYIISQSFWLSSIVVISFLAMFYFSSLSILLNAPLNVWMHVCMNYLFVIVIASLIPMVDNKLIKKLSRYFLNLSLILVVADTVYRLGNPMSILLGFASLFEGSTEFYIFKENSILFGDSNSSAFLVGTLLLFVYYSPNVKHKRIYFIALVTVLLLTFSRAAYIGYAAVALAWTLDKILPTSEKIGEKLVFVISFGLLLLFAFFPDLFRNITILSNDGSFQMKIYALHNLNILYQNSDLFSKIFGIGFGNAWLLKGFWPHNLISTYLIESGVTGLFLHFTFTFIILLKTRFRFLGYHIFLFLCGISFVPLGIPYFYVSLLILDRLRKISKAN